MAACSWAMTGKPEAGTVRGLFRNWTLPFPGNAVGQKSETLAAGFLSFWTNHAWTESILKAARFCCVASLPMRRETAEG
jgi:hypothetical protein